MTFRTRPLTTEIAVPLVGANQSIIYFQVGSPQDALETSPLYVSRGPLQRTRRFSRYQLSQKANVCETVYWPTDSKGDKFPYPS